MSYIFEIEEETVWSPALLVGRLYTHLITSLSQYLRSPAGFSFLADDFVIIDGERHREFTIEQLKLIQGDQPLTEGGSPGNYMLTEQLRPAISASIVMLDRGGFEVSSRIHDEQWMDYIRRLALKMPT